MSLFSIDIESDTVNNLYWRIIYILQLIFCHSKVIEYFLHFKIFLLCFYSYDKYYVSNENVTAHFIFHSLFYFNLIIPDYNWIVRKQRKKRII